MNKDVNETESDFEYVDKDYDHTETEDESNGNGDSLLNIVADVIKMEREIDAEASNIVQFSSDNISDQPLFLQPIDVEEAEDICPQDVTDVEIDGECLEMEIESHAACLEKMMPKTQSEMEMADSEESDSDMITQSEDNSLNIHRNMIDLTDSTDTDIDHISKEVKSRLTILPRRLGHLSNAEDTEYPESVQNSDTECLLSDFDVEVKTEQVLTGKSRNVKFAEGSQSAAESVVSAILSDVLLNIDNIMLEADNESDDDAIIQSVHYSVSAPAATAVYSAADLTSAPSEARPEPEAGGDWVGGSSCDDRGQEVQGSEARQVRDNSPTVSRDSESESSDPNAGLSYNEDTYSDKDYIQEKVEDLLNNVSSSEKMNGEDSEFDMYNVEDLDDNSDTEENSSVAKLAELKNWLDSKEREVNDMFDTNDDCSRTDDLDAKEEGNAETILEVQKDFNIQAEILKQLTESILASTEEKAQTQAKLSDTGEKILDSSSVLISPLTVDNLPRHKSVKKSSGKMKKNSFKSPLLRRKEIRTCINLHNDCENSDVLHEIISPALNYGAASVTVNGDVTYPDRRQEVDSRVHQINHDRDDSHPCQIEDPRKLDVSCRLRGRHELMVDVVVVRIIPPRAKFHADSPAYFDCISSFSPCPVNSDAAGCPGSPGRPSPSSS